MRAALPDLAGSQVQRLLDAVLDVASDLSLPDVLRRIVDSSVQLAGARYGALGVLDEDGSGFADFLFTGVDDTTSARIGRHPTGRGVLGLLIAQPEPVRLPDVRLHPTCSGSEIVWWRAQTRAWSATSCPSQRTRTRSKSASTSTRRPITAGCTE